MRQFYTLLFMLLLLLGIVVISVQAGELSLIQNQASETQKVIAEPGDLDPTSPGVTLLADYGSYQLFSVSNTQLNRLKVAQNNSFIVDSMDVMEINGHVLNTQNDASLMPPSDSSQQTAGNAMQLIQFVGPIKDEWLTAIRATGNEPIHYIANNGYLVWTDENGRSQLNTLHSQESFVQFNAPLLPDLKLSPDLVGEIEDGGKTAVVPIIIQMVQHAEQKATETIIENILVTQSTDWQPILKFQTIYGTVQQKDIAEIAHLPDVYWVGLQQPRELMDEVQGQIVAGNIITTGAYSAVPSGPGYLSWLDGYGFSQNPADYPIVDITDDGIGNGNANDAAGDQTLQELGLSDDNSRLAYIGNCTEANNGGGVGGHGHLNLSIAGGYDTRSGVPYHDDDGYQLGLGINPYGRFGGTRVFNFNGAIGATFWDISACGNGTDTDLIKQNQDSGASIINNSWGATSIIYNESAQAYDVGVRDGDLDEPGNQELIYIFSAGNAGASDSIGNPATAKNVITVGASENYRPYDIDGCNIGPNLADDVMDIVTFSSRGPAIGDRAKPELVAPGSHVQGTASTNPLFNGNTVCGGEDNDRELPANDAVYPPEQSVFTWSSGTSHAAPAVAGIASLYYYWLENNYHLNTPSPAMMKAYLIAHTLYLTGAGANDTLPGNGQGYGMPDMSLGLDNTPRVLLDQRVLFGESGEQWTHEVMVADPTKPVRVVLAYTDAAGAIGSSPQVNDLNLRIDSATSSYVGNHFQLQWSVPDGSPDSKNNYEAIFLRSGEAETLNLTVTAFNIAGDGVPNNDDETDQDFSLICYNCIEPLQITPSNQTLCTLSEDEATYEITAVPAQGHEETISYSANNLPPGTTAVFDPNPTTLPATSTLTISGLAASSIGEYLIEIQGISSLITRTTQAGLSLVTQPSPPLLTSPANDATVETNSVLLTWEETAQGKTYSVEIATDSSFTTIIESATDLSKTSYEMEGLAPDSTYYWRVNGNNACGTGSFSPPFTFSTQNKVYLPSIINE